MRKKASRIWHKGESCKNAGLSWKFIVRIFFLFALFVILASSVKTGTACTQAGCQSHGIQCPPNSGSYCTSYGTACNCYGNEGCIVTEQSIPYESYCWNTTHYYYQGCVDNQHPEGLWGPYACPTGQYCTGQGVCTSTPPSCTINSVTVLPQCSGSNPTKCEQGESISITVSYSGSCPSTSYLQVDAIDENNECIIERVGGDMQGMSFTCTSSPCTGIWQIPSIPNECKGKQMFAWSAGLYNNPDYQPNHYVTGKQANVPPGFPQNWTFIEAAPPQPVPGCYIASSCSSNYKAIFSVSDVTNAHGSIYNNSPTDYKRVCCPGTNISYGEYVVGAGGTYNNQYVLRFSNYTNAHVQQNDKTDYTYAVKIKKTDGNYATCTYQDITCPSTHPMCIVSISGDNNAHVANCSGTGAYTRKVCCDLSVGGVPSTACNITNASIKQYCGNDGVCNASIDKIELNISVENYQNCINPNNGWIHYKDSNCEEEWFIDNIMRQGNNYVGNWTVNTANPQYCLGE
ncbi:MAG: hypothetical protein QW622_03690, partial [Candidatus Pacearchaeota archaeon]